MAISVSESGATVQMILTGADAQTVVSEGLATFESHMSDLIARYSARQSHDMKQAMADKYAALSPADRADVDALIEQKRRAPGPP